MGADAVTKLCFVDCPHLLLKQLNERTVNLKNDLKKNEKKKVSVKTVQSK